MDLLRERELAHLGHCLVEVGQDLFVVLAHLETLSIDYPEVPDLVEIEVAAAGDWLTDTGSRHLFTKDRVDQGGLADSGFAEDRQVEPTDSRVLLLIFGSEGVSKPVCARHRARVRAQNS